jgi:hypothetical protein
MDHSHFEGRRAGAHEGQGMTFNLAEFKAVAKTA